MANTSDSHEKRKLKKTEANPYTVELEFTRKGETPTMTEKEKRKSKARHNLLLAGGEDADDIVGIHFVDQDDMVRQKNHPLVQKPWC